MHDGQLFAIEQGSLLLIELPSNPSSGYSWSLAPLDDTHLVLVHSSYRGRGPAVGSGGTETWSVRAIAPGRSQIHLKRWRPWEGEKSVIERFAVSLDIR